MNTSNHAPPSFGHGVTGSIGQVAATRRGPPHEIRHERAHSGGARVVHRGQHDGRAGRIGRAHCIAHRLPDDRRWRLRQQAVRAAYRHRHRETRHRDPDREERHLRHDRGHANGQTLYTFNSVGLTAISTATHKVVAVIPLPATANNVAVTPDGSTVYVTGSRGLYAISTATNKVIAT